MRKYLRELYKKPEYHKKNFALFISGAVTLFIFSIWSMVMFGNKESKLAQKSEESAAGEVITPLRSARMNLGSSLEAIRRAFDEVKGGLEEVNVESKYEDLRNGALDKYYE